MPEALVTLYDWLLSLGPRYGVNAWVFAALYLGSIPLFLALLAWTAARM